MMGEVAENLKLAKALIQDKRNWTQGELARNKYGKATLSNSEEACQWCSLGACQKVLTQARSYFLLSSAEAFLDSSSLELYNLHIEPANDIRTHADVMKIFDLAIQYSEEENV